MQSTGVLVINNYGPFFYSVLGFNTEQQLYLAAGYICTAFVFGFLSIFLIDRFGRVKLMGYGSIAQVGCVIIEAAIVANDPTGTNKALNKAGVSIFFLYCAVYSISWDCTQFVYIAELMPTHLRAKGVTLGIAALYLCDVGYLT